MTWLFPSVIATLCGAVLLTALFCYLAALYGQTYLKLWTISWGLYSLRFVAMLVMVAHGSHPLLLFAHQSLSLLSGTLLLAGAVSFTGNEMSKRWWVLTSLGIVFIGIGISMKLPFMVLALPTFAYLAAVDIRAGLNFLKHTEIRGFGSSITGWTLIVWGLHKADYPWLRNVEWFAPWGYLIGAVLSFVTAFGILISYFEALRASYEATANNYRNLIDSAPYGIAAADPDTGILLHVNKALVRLCGRSSSELVGKPQRILHPVAEIDADGKTGTFKRHLEEDLGNTLLAKVVTSSGTIKDVEIKSTLANMEGKRIALGFFNDVTEKLASERQIAARDAQLRAIFEAAVNISFIITDADYPEPTIIEFSPGAEHVFGYTREEAVGKPVSTLHSPAGTAQFPETDRLLQEGRRAFGGETRLIRKGGDSFPALLTVYPLFDEKGAMTGALEIGIDITLRKQAEKALEKQKYLLEKSQEMGQIGTWEFDIAQNRLVWTDENCRIFGMPEGSVVTYEIFMEKVHPEDRSYVHRKWTAAMEGEPYDIEHRVKVDGETKWVREKAEVLFDTEGVALSAIGFTQDVTGRKRYEAEKEKLEFQIRESQKLEAVGTLAGGVAHDFNNILGAILGYSELALERLPDGSEIAADITQVLRAGERARELVKQILVFSRKGEQNRQPVQAHLAVGEAMRLMRHTIPANIAIEVDIKKQDDVVLGDPTQIHQIVMNLCTNAYHALGGRGGRISVSLRSIDVHAGLAGIVPGLRVGPYVRLAVADTGVGMDPVTLSRVYEPFFTTKPKGEGTGMGLAVVHGIVSSHEGAILIESQLGKGTSVEVYFPRYVGSDLPESEGEPVVPRGSERILVVDDEANLALMTRKMLQNLGYEVEVVFSSREALELFSKSPDAFDLVITDQTMPDLTGDQLVASMLATRPDTPILICTGYSAQLDAEKAVRIGARGLLNKPLNRSTLAARVREALETNCTT